MPEPTLLEQLCQRLDDRITVLRLNGQRADDEAVAFFAGAASALHVSGQREVAEKLHPFLVMVVAVRGMFGVRETLHRLRAERRAST